MDEVATNAAGKAAATLVKAGADGGWGFAEFVVTAVLITFIIVAIAWLRYRNKTTDNVPTNVLIQVVDEFGHQVNGVKESVERMSTVVQESGDKMAKVMKDLTSLISSCAACPLREDQKPAPTSVKRRAAK